MSLRSFDKLVSRQSGPQVLGTFLLLAMLV